MKRKELAKYIDQMSDHIDQMTIVPKVRVHGSDARAKALQDAQLSHEDVSLIRAGAIAALIEAHELLTGRKQPYDPEDQAEDMMINTIGLMIEHRAEMLLKDMEHAND